jgi:hypothetical protein
MSTAVRPEHNRISDAVQHEGAGPNESIGGLSGITQGSAILVERTAVVTDQRRVIEGEMGNKRSRDIERPADAE